MRTRAMTALAFLIAFVPSVLFAGWAGPETVVSGTWGKADDQFTLESEDMGDVFPTEFFVLADGSILIQDGKLKVYRNGRFFKALDLEGDALFCDDAIVVWQRARKTKTSPTPDLTYLTAEGRLIKKIPHTALAGRVLWIRRDCSIVTQDDDRVFRDYDREGRLQGTYFELSSIKHEILPGGGHRTLVSLGADNIVLAGEHYGSFVHDDKGSISIANDGGVELYDACGNKVESLSMPKDVRFEGDGSDGEREEFVHDEYGEPFVDVHGNVYVWKKTPVSYSILKWSRQGSAVVPLVPPPSAVMTASVPSGLYVTWKQSPQDPGCVTEYEIVRAMDRCGHYRPLASTDKGVLKYKDTNAETGVTYSYKVRALSGKHSSLFSQSQKDDRACSDGALSRMREYFEEKTYTGATKQYTDDDIELWRSLGDEYSGQERGLLVKALRNEIYARHGRSFENQDLKRIFGAVTWYKPRSDFSEAELNKTEKRNIETLLRYESHAGWR